MCCRLARLPASMCPGEPPAPDWNAAHGTGTLIRPLRGRVWSRAAQGAVPPSPSLALGGRPALSPRGWGCPMQCALAAGGDGQARPLPPPPGAPQSTRSLACCLLQVLLP